MIDLIKLMLPITLTVDHLKHSESYCPFGKLIVAVNEKKLTIRTCRKNETDIESMISRFDRGRVVFNFDREFRKLKKEDIKRVFGICDGKEKFNMKIEKRVEVSNFDTRGFLGTCRNLYKTHIEDALKLVVKGNQGYDVADATRLLTLYCLLTLFIPKGATWGWSLACSYVKFLLDFEKLKIYDWSGHFHELLITSLKTDEHVKVKGCVYCIPFWFMESFKSCEPANPNEEMMCQKWSIPQLTEMTRTDLSIIQLSQRMLMTENRELKKLNHGLHQIITRGGEDSTWQFYLETPDIYEQIIGETNEKITELKQLDVVDDPAVHMVTQDYRKKPSGILDNWCVFSKLLRCQEEASASEKILSMMSEINKEAEMDHNKGKQSIGYVKKKVKVGDVKNSSPKAKLKGLLNKKIKGDSEVEPKKVSKLPSVEVVQVRQSTRLKNRVMNQFQTVGDSMTVVIEDDILTNEANSFNLHIDSQLEE